jgi:TonB family protein
MNNNTLTDDQRLLELLEKWNSGDFTRSDEQALRQLASTDEFRRESVEGYLRAPSDDHQQSLERIAQRLQARAQPMKARWAYWHWAAVAASIAVFAVAIWTLIPTQEKRGEIIAQTPDMEMADDRVGERGTAPTADSAPAEHSGPIVYNQSAPARSSQRTAVQPRLESDYSRKKEAESANIVIDLSEAAKTDKMAPKPQQTTVPASAPSRSAAAKDTAPSTADIGMASEGEISERAEQAVKAKKSASERAEEAVKDRKSAQKALNESVEDVFSRYLYQNARLPYEAKNNNVSGFVRVRFSINDKGKASNATVIRPLGYECDEAALRLVNAYNWPASFRPPAPIEVDVPFIK